MGDSDPKKEGYNPSESSVNQYTQTRHAESSYRLFVQQSYQASSHQHYYQHQHQQQQTVSQNVSSPNAGGDLQHNSNIKFDEGYSKIADNYSSLEQVTDALARGGLESSNLIVGIDFTKSNEWTAFDEDNLIPCYGFGDATTHDQDVFSFYPEDRACHGFEEVLSRYSQIVPHIRLAGPTSFAPIIEMATSIVEQSGGQYHVLLIIADGQVTRSVATEPGQLSPQEQRTVDAIVQASKVPLSIILVGVGDGPWEMMIEFDDKIPARDFDNFQFVNFTKIMAKNLPQIHKETEFAISALMEIPSQYRATIELKLLG